MRKSKLFRMGCFMFAGLFFAISQVWAVNSDPGKISSSIQSANIERLLKLKIPSGWGIIKDSYNSGTDKLIVNIQDAHCDFEAQKNIAKILNQLVLENKLEVVTLEGASGEVKNPILSNFPDKKVRGNVSLDLVKQGKLTGAEYFAVNSDYDLKLYGVEDIRLYMDNLAAFQQAQPFKKEAKLYFVAIKNALDILKQQIYNIDLKKIDSLENEYALKRIGFDNYASELYKLVEENGLRKVNYPIFYELQDAIKLELNVDFKKADAERMQLITILTQVINDKQIITKLVDKSLDFRKGMISAGDFANFLKDLAFEYKVTMGGFPNFNIYAEYITKYEQVANEDLFIEIKVITKDLKKMFYTNDDQKQLDVLYENLNILVKLLDLQMDNEDIAYFFKNRSQINSDSFIKFIEPQAYKHKVVVSLPAGISYIDLYIPDWAKFYELADTRDSAFIEKTLTHMDNDNVDYAALITGGFHSKQLTRILKEKKISYIVIAPKASVSGENPYFNLLQGGETDIQKFLNNMQSTLALVKPTSDEAVLKELNDAEQVTLKDAFVKQGNEQTFSLAFNAFALIASENPEVSDEKIQSAVISVFEGMNKARTDAGQAAVVDIDVVKQMVEPMHRQGNDKETSSVVVQSGNYTLVFNPAVSPGETGRITFNSGEAAMPVVLASANENDVSSQFAQTAGGEVNNSNITSLNPKDVVTAVLSSSANSNDAAKVVRISAIAEKVITALTFTGSADVDAIEVDLKGNTAAGGTRQGLFNVAGLKSEIQKVVDTAQSLILEKSSSAKDAAIIAVGEKGLKLNPDLQETAVIIISNALIEESDHSSMLTSVSGQLAKVGIAVDKLELADALNTGLAGAYTAEAHSGDIIAKVVILELDIPATSKTVASLAAIIKDNTIDTKAKTNKLAAILKIDENKVSAALFSGLKQANIAANPIIFSSSSMKEVVTTAQESFMAANIKPSIMQDILSKAEKNNAPDGEIFLLQGTDMDGLVLGVAAQVGIKTETVDALFITKGDYSAQSDNISIKIIPSTANRVCIEIRPKNSTVILNPEAIDLSEKNKVDFKSDGLSTIVGVETSFLEKNFKSATMQVQALNVLENTNDDSARDPEGINIVCATYSMLVDRVKSQDGTMTLVRKGYVTNDMLKSMTASGNTRFVLTDDIFDGKDTVSPEAVTQALGLPQEIIDFVGPMDIGAAQGNFTAQVATSKGVIQVVQQRYGKVNNFCFIASKGSDIEKQVGAINKDDAGIDAKVSIVSYSKPGEKQIINVDIPIAKAIHVLYNGTASLAESKALCLQAIKSNLQKGTLQEKELIITIGEDLDAFMSNMDSSMMLIKDIDKDTFIYVQATTFA